MKGLVKLIGLITLLLNLVLTLSIYFAELLSYVICRDVNKTTSVANSSSQTDMHTHMMNFFHFSSTISTRNILSNLRTIIEDIDWESSGIEPKAMWLGIKLLTT